MKKIMLMSIYGILFFPTSFFIYSAIGNLGNQKTIISTVETDTSNDHKFVKANDKQPEVLDNFDSLKTAIGYVVKEEIRSLNHFDYITKMNHLVTVSFGVFTFFIALNIVSNHRNLKEANQNLKEAKQNLKEAKQELSDFKSQCEKLEKEKDSIINDIKNKGEILFDNYLDTFRTRLVIKEIKRLLSKKSPNRNHVYAKLSSIIEDIDNDTMYIVTKCTDAFPNDENFLRLTARAVSNIEAKKKRPFQD